MNLYIYSDESGVFDKYNERYFVFAGLIFLSKIKRDIKQNKYCFFEKKLKEELEYNKEELKASTLNKQLKQRIFKYFNDTIKFSTVISLKKLRISMDKKTKQRFLDYAFKRAIKNCFLELLKNRVISKNDIEFIYIFCDEHTTATNGIYELQESLLQEFKLGNVNFEKNAQFPPLFTNLKDIHVSYCNSKNKPLIRAADIIANKIFNHYRDNYNIEYLKEKVNILELP